MRIGGLHVCTFSSQGCRIALETPAKEIPKIGTPVTANAPVIHNDKSSVAGMEREKCMVCVGESAVSAVSMEGEVYVVCVWESAVSMEREVYGVCVWESAVSMEGEVCGVCVWERVQ
jgi:hypothetical protein